VLALVIMDTVLVVLVVGLVAGLLRSHTEILQTLQSLRRQLAELQDSRGRSAGATAEADSGSHPQSSEPPAPTSSKTPVQLRSPTRS